MAFMLGLGVGMLFHLVFLWGYKRNLIHKARASEKGISLVEFIHGKPIVVMTEKKYVSQLMEWQKQAQEYRKKAGGTG